MRSAAKRVLGNSRRQVRALCTHLGWHARPDFLIIGAQKAGTSALHSYLLNHPQVSSPSEKELCFFSPESFYPWPDFPGYERYRWFGKGHADPLVRPDTARWYHSQFGLPLPWRRRLHHEASTCYLFFPETARRIHEYRPEMKLIVLLRDPVERAFSAWNMLRGFTFEPWSLMRDSRSFEQALREEAEQTALDPHAPTGDYLRRGIYHEQLGRYFDRFPREQILILEQKELLTHRWATVNAACRFLNITPFERDHSWPAVNVGSYDSEMSPAARDFLTDFYAPHNEALFALIGRELDWATPAAARRVARAASR